jgi:hypothetical protein
MGEMTELAVLVIVRTAMPMGGDLETERQHREDQENRNEPLSSGPAQHKDDYTPASMVLRRTSVRNRCKRVKFGCDYV